MGKTKGHSKVEIAKKLAQANDLATQGKLQGEIARTLGVSVMTLHRWRKALPVEVTERGRTRRGAAKLLNSSSKIHGCGDW
jgi:putative transposase